ncbi:MAG: hypothetical protein FJX76_15175 [Armatimonadetes bacterium]|nr:hypothetical protein [Armatimonadota bacterium]
MNREIGAVREADPKQKKGGATPAGGAQPQQEGISGPQMMLLMGMMMDLQQSQMAALGQYSDVSNLATPFTGGDPMGGNPMLGMGGYAGLGGSPFGGLGGGLGGPFGGFNNLI